MKFLYQTFTDYNLEEFTRFNMIVPLRISKYRPKILAVCYILMTVSYTHLTLPTKVVV